MKMNSSTTILLLIGIAIFACLVDSRRMTRSQKLALIKRNKWTRDITANVTVKEVAAVLKSKERIFFKSADRKLRKEGIAKSVSYLDNSSDLMVVKAYFAGNRKCILLPSNLTKDFNATSDDLLGRTNVNETVDIGDFMMTSDSFLSTVEREEFKTNNTFLAKVCRRYEIVNATLPVTETSDVLDKVPFRFISIEGLVTVYISLAIGLGPV